MLGRLGIVAVAVTTGVAVAVSGCNTSSIPTAPTNVVTPPQTLDRAAVIEALDYWRSAAGLDYVLIETNTEPRILIRPGTDGLPSYGGGRGGIDGTYPGDNQARSGLVVIEPGGGQFCRIPGTVCRGLYRHEVGHALGFLAHSEIGLMNSSPDTLLEPEKQMILALYSLPHGAHVEPDGSWSVLATGASGRLANVQTAKSDRVEYERHRRRVLPSARRDHAVGAAGACVLAEYAVRRPVGRFTRRNMAATPISERPA